MENLLKRTKILYISRPFINDHSGTGEQMVATRSVENLVKRKEYNVSYINNSRIKPYHGISSLIFYDYINSFYMALRNIFMPNKLVIFNSPYQALFAPIFNIRSQTICICNDLFFIDTENQNNFDKYSNIIHKIAFKFCTSIVTTSDETAEKIMYLYNQKPTIALLGIDRSTNQSLKNSPIDMVGYIGSYVDRKRPELLYELALLLDKENIGMMIAGNITDYYKNKFSKLSNVKILGSISEKEKIKLYQNISFLYFPTKLEGFGLPLVDAMEFGVVPIVQSDANIPKVVKSACIAVDSPNEAYKQIINFIEYPSVFNEMIVANAQHAKIFDWGIFVDKLLTVSNNGATNNAQ